MSEQFEERYLTPEETRQRLGLAGENTLAVWRHQDSHRERYGHIRRKPLPWIYLPGTEIVRYRLSDLTAWLESEKPRTAVRPQTPRLKSPGRPRLKQRKARKAA
jgi:hypothetical protein